MIEIGVNPNSGYTYLFSYDLPFVLTTDNMNGEEHERTLDDATQSDLELWSYKVTA